MSSFGATTVSQFRSTVTEGYLSPAELSSILSSQPNKELVNIDGNVVQAKYIKAGKWAVLTPEIERLLQQISF